MPRHQLSSAVDAFSRSTEEGTATALMFRDMNRSLHLLQIRPNMLFDGHEPKPKAASIDAVIG